MHLQRMKLLSTMLAEVVAGTWKPTTKVVLATDEGVDPLFVYRERSDMYAHSIYCDGDELTDWDAVDAFFELDPAQSAHLFLNRSYMPDDKGLVTPLQVKCAVDRMIREYENNEAV